MSSKSTVRLTREKALHYLFLEIPHMSNDVLGDLLDAIADSGQGHYTSKFDNFIVSNFTENTDE